MYNINDIVRTIDAETLQLAGETFGYENLGPIFLGSNDYHGCSILQAYKNGRKEEIVRMLWQIKDNVAN